MNQLACRCLSHELCTRSGVSHTDDVLFTYFFLVRVLGQGWILVGPRDMPKHIAQYSLDLQSRREKGQGHAG